MMITDRKRTYLRLLVIMVFSLMAFKSSISHAAATKLIWDKSDFRCGDICDELELGYKIYAEITGVDFDPNKPKKVITDPNITECDLSELNLIPGESNYILIMAYKKSGNYIVASDYSDSDKIIWEDMPPGVPSNLWSIPDKATPINNEITIGWDAAIDAGGSGLAGYYIKLSANSQTVPNITHTKISAEDTTITIKTNWPEVTSKGDYFFHLRAVDGALNLGNTVHYGPFEMIPGPALTISYSDPNRPYYVEGIFTENDGTIMVTATFTAILSGIPKITIDYSGGDDNDIPATDMTATVDNTIWTYLMVIPAGHDGEANITISGSDITGNPVGAHFGNEFIVDNTGPSQPGNLRILSP